jgi:hypothetical protein
MRRKLEKNTVEVAGNRLLGGEGFYYHVGTYMAKD